MGEEGCTAIDTRTGKKLWTMGDPDYKRYPQAGSADGVWLYSIEEKIFYTVWPTTEPSIFPRDEESCVIDAWNFADPTKMPTLMWSVPEQGIYGHSDWQLEYANGKIYYGTNDARAVCRNAKTGAVIWEVGVEGNANYGGTIYMGIYVRPTVADNLVGLDAETGARKWTFRTNTFWSFWSCGPAAAYGMIYEVNTDGFLYALDVLTGKVVWKYGGWYQGNKNGVLDYYPGYPRVADGKVYSRIGNRNARDQNTGEYSKSETVCLDAYTGKLIWTLPLECGSHDALIIAYGNCYYYPRSQNLYPPTSIGLNEIWCIGDSTPTKSGARDWTQYRGDAALTSGGTTLGTGQGFGGPRRIAIKWTFKTAGGVVSSPTIVNGIVYVGSLDKYLYAINADTGAQVWKVGPLGFNIYSSQAVVNGKLYTGADDGYVYCLNAATGVQLWKTLVATSAMRVWQLSNTVPTIRSSPTVRDGKVYVGTLDGDMCCLDANTGNILWKYASGGPIVSTAATITGFGQVDGIYYTASTPYPNAALYKLNFNGGLIWKLDIPRSSYLSPGYNRIHPDLPSPTVAADIGMIYQPDDHRRVYGINAVTKEIVWTFKTDDRGAGGPPQALCSALYTGDMVIVQDNFAMNALNPKNGSSIWRSWVAREVYNCPTYSYGLYYVASEEGTMRVHDAATGVTVSYYHPGINIWSSPSLYNGKLYWGALDFNVYCFGEADVGLTTYYGK
jgi:outer membrane protein assembly factor BamB